MTMNAASEPRHTCCRAWTTNTWTALEEEAIFILREGGGQLRAPCPVVFSGGKDSCVVLRLAEKAFKHRM